MKKIAIIIVSIIVITLVLVTTFVQNNINKVNYKNVKLEETNLKVTSEDGNNVLLEFTNMIGIKEIKFPNGLTLYGNGKSTIAADYQIEKTINKYDFEIVDMDDEVITKTVYAPTMHIEISKNNMTVSLQDIQSSMISNLNSIGIATNYMKISIGEQTSVNSETMNMSTVFSSWQQFGDGTWSYNSSSKTVVNSKNSDYITGYYDKNNSYDDIDISFNAKTTDADDDAIGAVIRFNSLGSSKYSSYVFFLDRHDNGGGIGNGAYNGLNKVVNNTFTSNGTFTKLAVNASWRWTRNTWENYRLVTKGTTVQAYMNNKLLAEVTDTSISKGTYGFISYSQAYTYFKDIVVKTNKSYTFPQLLAKIVWNVDEVNMIINLNNAEDTTLNTQECIDLFNAADVHYLGVTAEANKESVNSFVNNINNRGQWIDSSDYDTYIQQIGEYIKTKFCN